MNKNLQDIDAHFKKSIDEYEEMPSKNVWENIDKSLNEKNLFTLKIKYAALKKYAAILLLILLGSTCYYVFTKKIFHTILIKTEKVGDITSIKNRLNNDLQTTVKTHTIIDKDSPESLRLVNKSVPEFSGNIFVDKQSNNKLPIRFKPKYLLSNKKYTPSAEIKLVSNLVLKQPDTGFGEIKNPEQNPQNTAADINFPPPEIALLYKEKFSLKNKPAKRIAANPTGIYVPQKILTNFDKIKIQSIFSTYILVVPNTISYLSISTIHNNRRKSNTAKHRFTAIIYASPEMAFDRLEDDKFHENSYPAGILRISDNRQKIKEEEHHSGSFSTGVILDYRLKNNFSIQSGISLVSKYANSNPKTVFAEMDDDGTVKYKYNCAFGSSYINPKIGAAPIIGDSAIASTSTNKIRYLGVPLNISYHINKGRFQISPTAGATINFLIEQSNTTGLTDASGLSKPNSTGIIGLKSIFLNANAGIDFSYKLNGRIAIMAMPSMTLALGSINHNSIVKSFPNTFGIKAGLKIAL